MKEIIYTSKDKVKKYPGKWGWVYINISKEVTDYLRPLSRKCLIPIVANTGKTSWETSLIISSKDKAGFVPLKANVRKEEEIKVGDEVTVSFHIKEKI